ncbi:tetratricopeptide repeat protein [Agarilytica rhodophyticola]|uniref:tetratricopeptide repeat protein n=1 Tax=Agarilytica rhodophyticola TaxID=1737490 RepID=UPI0013159609|nr:tetratricopeptide repeat protein [Agarilytica rhodophyticola]
MKRNLKGIIDSVNEGAPNLIDAGVSFFLSRENELRPETASYPTLVSPVVHNPVLVAYPISATGNSKPEAARASFINLAATVKRANTDMNRAREFEKKGEYCKSFRAYCKGVNALIEAITSHQKTNGKGLVTPQLLQALERSVESVVSSSVKLRETTGLEILADVGKLLENEYQADREFAPVAKQTKVRLFSYAGTMLLNERQYNIAKQLLSKSFQASKQNKDLNHATIATNLGLACFQLQEYENAKIAYRDALAAHIASGSDSEDISSAQQLLGIAYTELEQYGKAKKCLEYSYDMAVDQFGKIHNTTLACLDKLICLNIREKDFSKAEKRSEEYLDGVQTLYGNDHIKTAQAILTYGKVKFELGKNIDALALAEQALAINTKEGQDWHTADCRHTIASIYRADGKHDEAYLLFTESFNTLMFVNDKARAAEVLDSAVNMLESLGRMDAAKKLCSNVLEIREQVLGKDHSDTKKTREELHVLQELTNN